MTDQLTDTTSGQDADASVLDNAATSSTENRDERGRFANQQQQDDPNARQQESQGTSGNPPEGFVPIQALDARLAQRDEKWQRRLDEQQQAFLQRLSAFAPQRQQEQKTAPHFFDDPDAAFDNRIKAVVEPLQQGQKGIIENFSRMMASDKFGEDVVDNALNELTRRVDQNPGGMRATYDRIMQSRHPYGELVKWHKETSALSTYGDDPEAYIKAEVERRLAEASGQQHDTRGSTQQPQQQQMPSSFAGARNNGPRSMPGSSGPKSLSDIMGR